MVLNTDIWLKFTSDSNMFMVAIMGGDVDMAVEYEEKLKSWIRALVAGMENGNE